MKAKQKLIILILSLLPSLTFSQPKLGASFHFPLVAKDPKDLRGFQLMLQYDPERYTWRSFNVFFDGGFSHFWLTKKSPNDAISILSASPVIRYTFKSKRNLKPYLDLGIGLSYLNRTRFENRNLGIHFSFQDRIGVGVLFGCKKQFSVGLTAIHYSNANFSKHNSGISIPLMLSISYLQ